MSTEQNKAIIRRWFEALNAGSVNLADEIYAPNFVNRSPDTTDPTPGPEGVKQRQAAALEAFPDMHITIDDMIAEGDKVVTRYTVTGTHKTEFMGIAPTGKRFSMTVIGISRFLEGKVVEVWEVSDNLGALQQLGVIPPLGEG